jgi:uncharacterized protein (DUF2236 family)
MSVTAPPAPARAPLGPGSLTWRLLGDSRGTLLAVRAAVLQVMHPAIAAGLRDHSDFFENPIGRLARSAGPILGVVYDEDPAATGAWVRDQHPEIRGRDREGRAYHALDPATYYWAHATFFEAQIATQELFGTPLSRAEKERLYAESVTWYARYGLTMRPVPADYSAFERYWHRTFEEVLEPTSLARAAVRAGGRLPRPSERMPAPLWAAAAPLAARSGPWLARATLPAEARALLGIEPSAAERAELRALQHLVRGCWPLVPRRLRMLPRARRGD